MKDNQHLWQGRWISDSDLTKSIQTLPALLEQHPLLETQMVLTACQTYKEALVCKTGNYSQLIADLDETGLSIREAQTLITEMALFLDSFHLKTKLKRELGSHRPFNLTRAQYQSSVFEAWSPLGLLVHVTPANALSVAPLSVVEGLLAGNLNFLKSSASVSQAETRFMHHFLEGLGLSDSTGQLPLFIIAARISSSDQERLKIIFSAADAVCAYGSDETMEAIKKLAPRSTPLIEWGHKISFMYLSRKQMQNHEVLVAAAKDICELDQQACSSPQCLYLETDDQSELKRWSRKFADVLNEVSKGQPRSIPLQDDEQAEITLTVLQADQEASFSDGLVIQDKENQWRILVDMNSSLMPSPLFRTIWIKPLLKTDIISFLKPMRAYLQTVGLACDLGEVKDLSDSFFKAGALRIRQIGQMTSSYEAEPHDGVYPLTRYCKRVSMQLGDEAKQIYSFSDLTVADKPRWPHKPEILTKEQFQEASVESRFAQLFFKSGGSSGKPKLSVFTYDDYEDQMQAGLEGLFAAGLDPLTDRNINLFFVGSLYGGFLSIFSVLQMMDAVHFPMAAIQDLDLVAETIIKNNVNVILGMPSYIIQLFEKKRELFANYKGIQKIFYGGEHFNDNQRRWLTEEFSVSLIKSIGYGSVDLGPLGYQCSHCEGGIHHLHQRLQYLEIVKLDQDQPVGQTVDQAGDVGRLIFTTRSRQGQNLDRYDIGDVGRWIQKPCPCGRLSPRFQLLGRSGDVFRIGSIFLNYQKFVQILEETLNYNGFVQVELSDEGGQKEAINLHLSHEVINGLNKSGQDIKDLVLNNYDDLQEVVSLEGLLNFEIKLTDTFEKTKTSGKLVRVWDRRGVS